MIEEPIENIDELVDGILGEAPEETDEFPYTLHCEMCGQAFGARKKGARFCMSCRQKMRQAGGRKGTEKAHGLRKPEDGPPRPEGPAADKVRSGLSLIGPTDSAEPQAEDLEADVRALARLQDEICARWGLTPGQLGEAVAALNHYRAVLKRLTTEERDAEAVVPYEMEEKK